MPICYSLVPHSLLLIVYLIHTTELHNESRAVLQSITVFWLSLVFWVLLENLILLCTSEYNLCLWCLNLFSSVHPGPLLPLVPDGDSLSQTSAPVYPHSSVFDPLWFTSFIVPLEPALNMVTWDETKLEELWIYQWKYSVQPSHGGMKRWAWCCIIRGWQLHGKRCIQGEHRRSGAESSLYGWREWVQPWEINMWDTARASVGEKERVR